MPINKELGNGKAIIYKIKFIDSFKFMSSSLSGLGNNSSEGIYNYKCDDCESCLDYISTKDNQLIFKCIKCSKNHGKYSNKNLMKKFENTCEFCNEGIIKFILLLRKGVYLYEYMDSWERFDETSLPKKEAFYSSLNIKGVTDIDYRYAKRVYKEFNNKNIGRYYDLCVQSHTLLLEGVFENFRNKCIEIYKLDPGHFLSALGLALQACLKKTEVKLELLTGIDTFLMVEKGIRGGITHAIHRYAKANNKYMKSSKKNKKSSYLIYLDVNNLYR